MYKKKARIIIISVLTLIIIITLLIAAPFLGLSAYKNYMLSSWKLPPEPQITYGEFPFEITYKIGGQSFSCKDVYICEYEGTDWGFDMGYFRNWRGYLKSNGEENLVLLNCDNRQIICTVGSPEYYMNAQENTDIQNFVPKLILLQKTEAGNSSCLLSKELQEYYNIELISWKLSEPIENSFRKTQGDG